MPTLASTVPAMVSLLLLGACPSTSVYRSANPVPAGEWRLGAATGLGAMSDREQETAFPTAELELSARRGLTASLDVGAKLYLAGTEINATWRVHQGSWSFALAPALSGLRAAESLVLPESIHLYAQLHGVASRTLSERWTLSVGPSSGAGLYWPVTGGYASGLWLGAFVNGSARLGRRWRITPEFSAYRVAAGQVPLRGGALRLGLAFEREL